MIHIGENGRCCAKSHAEETERRKPGFIVSSYLYIKKVASHIKPISDQIILG